MGWAGFLSMAIFRLPLYMNKNINFWKLLGCGKNGTFDIHPDWRQWAILTVAKPANIPATQHFFYGKFIPTWWKFFQCELYTFLLEPIQGHGLWNGKEAFGNLPKQTDYAGKIATLTRATIRLNRLKNFWNHVNTVALKMNTAEGFITSIGIGEVPWIRQATFSVWESKEHMKAFAYQMPEHTEVIRKTRKENWYSEDMFVRFKILNASGTLHGKNPLNTKQFF